VDIGDADLLLRIPSAKLTKILIAAKKTHSAVKYSLILHQCSQLNYLASLP